MWSTWRPITCDSFVSWTFAPGVPASSDAAMLIGASGLRSSCASMARNSFLRRSMRRGSPSRLPSGSVNLGHQFVERQATGAARAARIVGEAPAGIEGQAVRHHFAPDQQRFEAREDIYRKRHIAVDTDGRLLMVNLTTADISDSAGAQMILDAIRKRWPWVKHLFADGAYDRLQLMDKAAYLRFVLEIIRRREGAKGFEVQPRRWVVERTFGWMIRWRRLVRDYERRIDVSKAMIFVAMSGNLLRRNAHP